THSPRPSPSRTSDVGRTPPGYDGTRTAPTRHSASSTTTGSAASAASGVGSTAEAGEDLPALREVPVAERVADRDRTRRPRAAARAARVRVPRGGLRPLGLGAEPLPRPARVRRRLVPRDVPDRPVERERRQAPEAALEPALVGAEHPPRRVPDARLLEPEP